MCYERSPLIWTVQSQRRSRFVDLKKKISLLILPFRRLSLTVTSSPALRHARALSLTCSRPQLPLAPLACAAVPPSLPCLVYLALVAVPLPTTPCPLAPLATPSCLPHPRRYAPRPRRRAPSPPLHPCRRAPLQPHPRHNAPSRTGPLHALAHHPRCALPRRTRAALHLTHASGAATLDSPPRSCPRPMSSHRSSLPRHPQSVGAQRRNCGEASSVGKVRRNYDGALSVDAVRRNGGGASSVGVAEGRSREGTWRLWHGGRGVVEGVGAAEGQGGGGIERQPAAGEEEEE